MIQNMIPLLGTWLPVWSEYLVYFFALGFLAWFPAFVISCFRR